MLSGSVPSLKDKNALFSFILFLCSLQKSQSHAGSLVQRQSRPASLLWNGVMNSTAVFFCPLLPPQSLILSSLHLRLCVRSDVADCPLFSSPPCLVYCSLTLSLPLMLALIPPALLPPPSLPLSLSLSLQRQSFMHLLECACMHKQPSTSLSNAHNYDGGRERESMDGEKKRMRSMKSALNAPPIVT